MNISSWFPLIATATLAFAVHAGAAEPVPQFRNGALTDHVKWLDTSGNLINVHDGGIIHADGKYHWYGMAARQMSVKEGGQKTTVGVVMYSSTNLYQWDYEGVILECSTEPKHPLNGPMRFERPKIVYNDRTKKYVLWCHYVKAPGNHRERPGGGEAGVASCSTVSHGAILSPGAFPPEYAAQTSKPTQDA